MKNIFTLALVALFTINASAQTAPAVADTVRKPTPNVTKLNEGEYVKTKQALRKSAVADQDVLKSALKKN